MNYPVQCARTYANPGGNLAASGYYRSSITQETANMMPPWMHLRQNPRSIGQQFLSVPGVHLKRLENDLNDVMRNEFLDTARVDEVDVLYRVNLPSNVNLMDMDASGVRCIAAPSGCSPSGISQIWVAEISDLKEFYYEVLPTRIEVMSSGDYVSSVDSVSWNTKPSGILDSEEKWVDVWGTTHDISWCFSDGFMRKQDTETMEDYEIYTQPGTGVLTDMAFYRGLLWCVSSSGSDYYLTLASTKTQVPNETALDTLAIYTISDGFDIAPSGIIIKEDGSLAICDTNRTRIVSVSPRYDYFILDKDNRYVYFKEDYRSSGVFISNT